MNGSHKWILVPTPRQCSLGKTCFRITQQTAPKADDLGRKLWLQVCGDLLAAQDETRQPEAGLPLIASFGLAVDPAAVAQPQGYRLSIDAQGAQLIAHDPAGLFYGLMTLRQLLRQGHGTVPETRIEDWPDFAVRGVMMDISRDKVPEMETLTTLIDRLAELKYNQFQLYTEHTFAFRDHPLVWQDASPITTVQIAKLQDYCRQRFIELVPNQNSFGHMGRWLKHEPYHHLSEEPDNPNCTDLCPVDPGSAELLEGIYADLLPNFESKMFNVGLDETWSLGAGRSRQAAEAKGKGRVYLEFLKKINALVERNGRTMQFWGDIIIQHPELIPELPQGVIALEWGYEADHPFEEHGEQFARAGIPYYVAPGTSAWCSLVGRTTNAMVNLRRAAQNGLRNGASGYLVTDWGDCGHWQFLPVSYAGWTYGAAVSWAVEANTGLDVGEAMNVVWFDDAYSLVGPLALELGDLHLLSGAEIRNQSQPFAMLHQNAGGGLNPQVFEKLSAKGLTDMRQTLDGMRNRLSSHTMQCADGPLVTQELAWLVDLVDWTCELGLEQLKAGQASAQEMAPDVRQPLAARLKAMLPQYRQLWLARNRSGGLRDSVVDLEKLISNLERS